MMLRKLLNLAGEIPDGSYVWDDIQGDGDIEPFLYLEKDFHDLHRIKIQIGHQFRLIGKGLPILRERFQDLIKLRKYCFVRSHR